MLSKQIILLFTLFLAVFAENYDAYEGGKFGRKHTSRAEYKLQVYYAPDKASCWYVNLGDSQPACCLKTGKVVQRDAIGETGKFFDECINANKGVPIYDVKFNIHWDNAFRYQWSCQKESRGLGQSISKVKARCNKYGCLTRYGWIDKGNYRKVNC